MNTAEFLLIYWLICKRFIFLYNFFFGQIIIFLSKTNILTINFGSSGSIRTILILVIFLNSFMFDFRDKCFIFIIINFYSFVLGLNFFLLLFILNSFRIELVVCKWILITKITAYKP